MAHSETTTGQRTLECFVPQTRTDMTGAVLRGTDLRGVDLRYVRGLKRHQLRAARIDAGTLLPFGLRFVLMIEHFIRKLRRRRQQPRD